MVDKNFEFALADLTDAQRATANLLINQYRNQNDTRKQQSGKRQFGLENVHPTALKALIDDSLALIGNAPNTLQKDVSWLHWELLISEVSGHLEGMVLVDQQKVLSPIKGLCEIRLERFNPDGGRNIEINLTKGIVAILIRAFSNQHPSEIIEANTKFIDEIGLKEHLSPTRANGLVSMVKQLKMYAIAYQTQLN